MSLSHQQSLALIPHPYEGEVIRLRQRDGYINATAMCKAAGKAMADYNRLGATKAFLQELASEVGIPITELIQTLSGGTPQHQGSWVHPQVAIHMAQWLSPKFAVKVTEWVYEWMSGLSPTDKVWRQFEDRVSLVYDSVPEGYFCTFKESADLFAALIMAGANFGTKMILDISVGLHWANYWRDQGLAEKFGDSAYFPHNYPQYFRQALSNPQMVNCYPEEALPTFRRWMRNIYMPDKLPTYLRSQMQQKRIPASVATDALMALQAREQHRALARPTR